MNGYEYYFLVSIYLLILFLALSVLLCTVFRFFLAVSFIMYEAVFEMYCRQLVAFSRLYILHTCSYQKQYLLHFVLETARGHNIILFS